MKYLEDWDFVDTPSWSHAPFRLQLVPQTSPDAVSSENSWVEPEEKWSVEEREMGWTEVLRGICHLLHIPVNAECICDAPTVVLRAEVAEQLSNVPLEIGTFARIRPEYVCTPPDVASPLMPRKRTIQSSLDLIAGFTLLMISATAPRNDVSAEEN